MNTSDAHPWLLVLVLTCVPMTGCNAEESSEAEEAATHVGSYEAVGDGGDTALLEGTVRVIDGCFLVEDELNTRYLPYFPDDELEWSGASLRYRDETYGEGDAIALGGGVSGTPKPMPASCSSIRNVLRWTVAQSG